MGKWVDGWIGGGGGGKWMDVWVGKQVGGTPAKERMDDRIPGHIKASAPI